MASVHVYICPTGLEMNSMKHIISYLENPLCKTSDNLLKFVGLHCGHTMLVLCLLGFLTVHGALGAPFRGTYTSRNTTPSLIEGDIVIPASYVGRGYEELDAFLTDPELLWPNGFVPYCFETFEWEGEMLPIFLDDQIENITQALGKISRDVPCIKFK